MTCILALSVLTATFPGESGLASYFAAMDNSSNNNNNNNTNICKAHIVSIRDESEAEVPNGSCGDNWRYDVQSSQIITTNKPTPIFTDRIPFLSPNQQYPSTEGKRKLHVLFVKIII